MTDYTKEMAAAAAAAGLSPPRIVQPTDHEVRLGGLKLHYLDWGNAHLPPLLFLHGGRLTAHTWDMAALLLRDHYHIIALDQRGHGDSDWTPDGALTPDMDALDLMLEDTRRFIDHLGYAKLFLTGMSMGGINAMRYAARHPDRLWALGIVDVAPEVAAQGVADMEGFRQDTETMARFEDFLDRAVRYMPHRPVAQLRYSLMHSLKQLPDGRWTWKQDHRPNMMARGAAVTAANAGKAMFHDLWAELKQITVPSLLFWGAQSKILTRAVAERTVAAFPDARLVVIDPATHNVHSDNPKAFAAALDAFLGQHLPG